MAEQTAATGGTDGTNARPFTPIESQEAFDQAIQTRIARERAKFADYDQMKAAAAELATLKDAQKTETQKQTDRITALESQLAESVAAQARAEVAAETGIPAALLTGTTKQEMQASAAALKEFRDKKDARNGASREGHTRQTPRGDEAMRAFAHTLFNPEG